MVLQGEYGDNGCECALLMVPITNKHKYFLYELGAEGPSCHFNND